MASYATPAQVKSLFRDFPEPSEAAVTDAELQEFLDDAKSVIDARLNDLYILPIVDTEALNILKRVSTFKVACIVDSILNSYSKDEERPQWCKMGEALLDSVAPKIDPKTCKQCEPTAKLPNSGYKGTLRQRNGIKISKTEGGQFKKGVDTW